MGIKKKWTALLDMLIEKVLDVVLAMNLSHLIF